jgi:hypothetical protein
MRVVLGIAALSLGVSSGKGQDRPAAESNESPKRGQPGPEHQRLQSLVGTWNLSSEGAQEKGRAEIKSIFGGRFVTEEVKLPLGDFAMEWIGIYGYDRNQKKYTAVWVDNMDTTTESAVGEIDATGMVLTFKGRHINPHTGKSESYTWRIARADDRKLTIEMFEGDKERPAFVIHGEKVG